MSNSLSVIDHIAQSNIPVEKKTGIRRFFETAIGGGLTTMNAVGHVAETGAVLREGGEAIVVGGALGLLNASDKGLDWGKNKDVPVDGVIAGLGLAGAILMANHPLGIAADLRHAGSLALGILTFRKTTAWKQGKDKTATTPTVSGETEFDDDPILKIAKEL